MADSGREPSEVAKELGTDGKDTGAEGLHPTDIWEVFQGSGAGGTPILDGDVGDDLLHGTGHWRVLTQGIYMYHWEVAPAVSGRKLVVPTFGDGDAGGRV